MVTGGYCSRGLVLSQLWSVRVHIPCVSIPDTGSLASCARYRNQVLRFFSKKCAARAAAGIFLTRPKGFLLVSVSIAVFPTRILLTDSQMSIHCLCRVNP